MILRVNLARPAMKIITIREATIALTKADPKKDVWPYRLEVRYKGKENKRGAEYLYELLGKFWQRRGLDL
jgi:hypothetical protein